MMMMIKELVWRKFNILFQGGGSMLMKEVF